MSYQLPSATTYEINNILQTGNDEFSIQSEIELEVIEPGDLAGVKFTILYFNSDTCEESISNHYMIPADEFTNSLSLSECQDLLFRNIKAVGQEDEPREVLEISDFEAEVYPNSSYKSICYRQQLFNENKDGHRLRRNIHGRSKIYQLGRMSVWNVNVESSKSTPGKDPDVHMLSDLRDESRVTPNSNLTYKTSTLCSELQYCAFNEVERGKMAETIDAFTRNHTYSQNFVDVVTDDIAPDYQNIIAVEMNLYTIRDNIESGFYRSKLQLMHDLKQIHINSLEFNGDDSDISKDAQKVYENLKKIFDKALSYRLRSVPQRNTRNRGASNLSDNHNSRGNKREVKKTTPIKKRSTRRHATINYNEEAKMDKIFKKPTPQKHRGGYEEGSDSGDTPFGNSVEDASKDFGRMTELDRNKRNSRQTRRREVKAVRKQNSENEDESYPVRRTRSSNAVGSTENGQRIPLLDSYNTLEVKRVINSAHRINKKQDDNYNFPSFSNEGSDCSGDKKFADEEDSHGFE